MVKAITTVYNNYKFRSRLEARWAIFLDILGIRYEYEKEGFELPASEGSSDTIRYLPDFWLPDLKCWMEVKGEILNEKEDLWKPMMLSLYVGYPVYIVAGPIGMTNLKKRGECWLAFEHDYTGYIAKDGVISASCVWVACLQCETRGRKPTYGMRPVAGMFSLQDFEQLFCDCYKTHRHTPIWTVPLGRFFEDMEEQPLATYVEFLLAEWVVELVAACTIARQARFEHGESIAKYCHLSVKMYRFSDNLPRCQARLVDELSHIKWRSINFIALEACFAFQRLTFQLCAKLCLHKIALL